MPKPLCECVLVCVCVCLHLTIHPFDYTRIEMCKFVHIHLLKSITFIHKSVNTWKYRSKMHRSTRNMKCSSRRAFLTSIVSLVVCVLYSLCDMLCRLQGRGVYALIRDRHEEGGGTEE